MRQGQLLATLTALLALTGCHRTQPPSSHVVAAEHDAFFVWAGVPARPELAQAKVLYLLDGEVRAGRNDRFVALRPATPHVPRADVWMTVRVERLDWSEDVHRRIMADLARWQAGGNRLAGLQIDFDASTRGLDQYAAFLTDLRRRLPARYRLSVTGLMDWSAQADATALAKLAGTVDEVVIQTYQGRRTIPGYERYLATLHRLPLAYRIAVVEGGEWLAPADLAPDLAADPHYRGLVVFLLRDPPRQ
ncbi:DUF3142 domain-containing protein [Novosphingobium lentum]|uniref:DUF3142 domain-containing protein n=1 Tax=Novosphingobium lentum TaxID=145287 RepID=UPI000AE7F15A|nr:DUF3142 domain-containing protein [Novosphingobium lentum]